MYLETWKITENDYNNKRLSCITRTLFDIGKYRVFDAETEEKDTYYFVKDFSTNELYEINLSSCYQLISNFYCGYKPYVLECIDEMIQNVK